MPLASKRLFAFAVVAFLALPGCGDDTVDPATPPDAAAKDGTTSSEAGDGGTRESDAAPSQAAEAGGDAAGGDAAPDAAEAGSAEAGSDAETVSDATSDALTE